MEWGVRGVGGGGVLCVKLEKLKAGMSSPATPYIQLRQPNMHILSTHSPCSYSTIVFGEIWGGGGQSRIEQHAIKGGPSPRDLCDLETQCPKFVVS